MKYLALNNRNSFSFLFAKFLSYLNQESEVTVFDLCRWGWRHFLTSFA